MWNTGRWAKKLVDTLIAQEYLTFYHIMNYPIPKNGEHFFVASSPSKEKENREEKQQKDKADTFSRPYKPQLMVEYIQEIEKYKTLYQSLPFVEEIYLCNSISFNALHENSDIDLFIITQPERIRSAKFRAMLAFTFTGLKRTFNKKAKKICLSFFISADQQNLYSISLAHLDIYLCYRIQHLVLLYQADPQQKPKIFKKNKRIKGVLPHYPEEQSISLGNQVFSWATKIKQGIQRVGKSIIGDLMETLLKYLQLTIIRLKILRSPERNRDVIVNDQILKFHQDIRKKVSLKYSVAIKK